MAEHPAGSGAHGHDLEAHRATYQGFVKGAIVITLVTFYVLVALVAFRFAPTLNVLTGFAGLILGLVAVAIDARTGSRWLLSLGLLVLFGIVTAVSIS
jgi:hypothetical protein